MNVEEVELQRYFRLKLPSSHSLLQERLPWPLLDGVRKLLDQHGLTGSDVSDAFRKGPSIFFQVYDHSAAYDVVFKRYKLKGTGITIFDVLSASGEKQHAALMPRYLEALAQGQRAQFYRHRLKIDGKWV